MVSMRPLPVCCWSLTYWLAPSIVTVSNSPLYFTLLPDIQHILVTYIMKQNHLFYVYVWFLGMTSVHTCMYTPLKWVPRLDLCVHDTCDENTPQVNLHLYLQVTSIYHLHGRQGLCLTGRHQQRDHYRVAPDNKHMEKCKYFCVHCQINAFILKYKNELIKSWFVLGIIKIGRNHQWKFTVCNR